MYQVLYRKWRPKTFSDVYGQPHITSALKNAVAKNRISHAYLFTGSRGTGKTTCAKILAKAINCLDPQNGDPCGKCEICRGIDDGSILDILEIDAASNNGVDNIRDLREETNYTPANSRYRVYIIDEVHMLSIGAFNALLKTLEEPPSYVVFILATTEVHKIPSTILSRCQRFDFRRISPENISERLKYVAEQENKMLTDNAAMLIARLADGAMRDALSLLDLCMDFDGPIEEAVVSRAAGLADKDYMYKLSDAVSEKSPSLALSILDELHNSSCDMQRLCTEMLSLFRNYMIAKTVKNPENIIVATSNDIKTIIDKSNSFSTGRILRIMESIQTSLQNISQGADRRTETEMLFVKLCSKEMQTDYNSLLSRIEALEERPIVETVKTVQEINHTEDNFTESKHLNNISSAMTEIPPNSSQNKTSNDILPEPVEDVVEKFSYWKDVLNLIKISNKMLFSVLSGSNAFIRNGNMVLIQPVGSALAEIIKKDNNSSEIKSAIKKVTGIQYRLAVTKPLEAEQKKDDPLIDFVNSHRDEIDIEK